MKLLGIHHLTAICGNPARNVAFYTRVLGLRMIKRTVNFDDPGTWHLYYADHVGTPGTVLTSFPFAGVPQGRPGAGEVVAFAFSVPPGSLDYWESHFSEQGIRFQREQNPFGEPFLSLQDPDGFRVELVESGERPATEPWADSPIARQHAIAAFHSATFLLRDAGPTARLLTEVMGAKKVHTNGAWHRYQLGSGPVQARLDLHIDPQAPQGRPGSGSLHHIAFRITDNASQEKALHELRAAGVQCSPVRDRQYFHSIYFREPGGILFEIATEGPGFTIDESAETLGSELKLPPQYEHLRDTVANSLPPLE